MAAWLIQLFATEPGWLCLQLKYLGMRPPDCRCQSLWEGCWLRGRLAKHPSGPVSTTFASPRCTPPSPHSAWSTPVLPDPTGL